jgi:hypothetical protein
MLFSSLLHSGNLRRADVKRPALNACRLAAVVPAGPDYVLRGSHGKQSTAKIPGIMLLSALRPSH